LPFFSTEGYPLRLRSHFCLLFRGVCFQYSARCLGHWPQISSRTGLFSTPEPPLTLLYPQITLFSFAKPTGESYSPWLPPVVNYLVPRPPISTNLFFDCPLPSPGFDSSHFLKSLIFFLRKTAPAVYSPRLVHPNLKT